MGDWGNRRWVKQYEPDADWWVVPLLSRGLYNELATAVNYKTGRLKVGRHGPRGVAMAVRCTVDEVEAALPDLVDAGLVRIDDDWLELPAFLASQSTKKSNAASCRDYRDRNRQDVEHDSPSVANDSARQQATARDINRIEEEKTPIEIPPTPRKRGEASGVSRVLDHYVSLGHRRPKAADLLAKVKKRLERYTVEDICRALDALHASRFHQGHNEDGKKYLELHRVVDTDGKVEKWLQEADEGKTAPQQAGLGVFSRAAERQRSQEIQAVPLEDKP